MSEIETDQANEDVEGHSKKKFPVDDSQLDERDDVEGHHKKGLPNADDDEGDDVEGHMKKRV
jgi:hypothetical protein